MNNVITKSSKEESNETQKSESQNQQEAISWGHEGTQEKLPTPPDEGRRSSLNESVEVLEETYEYILEVYDIVARLKKAGM